MAPTVSHPHLLERCLTARWPLWWTNPASFMLFLLTDGSWCEPFMLIYWWILWRMAHDVSRSGETRGFSVRGRLIWWAIHLDLSAHERLNGSQGEPYEPILALFGCRMAHDVSHSCWFNDESSEERLMMWAVQGNPKFFQRGGGSRDKPLGKAGALPCMEDPAFL